MTKDEALKMAIEWVEGWKGIAPSKIELLRVLKEALEQPVKSITEGATMFKQIGNSPKPPSPLPPMHTCIYSRTMNQEYPRKCIQCGKVEAIGPAQEPVKNVTLSCGCKSHYLGFPSEWDGETKECQPCTNYGVLCEKHFKEKNHG